MAARESQGLQITLGVFVVLTLLLCVGAYFLFDGYRTQRDRADAAVADAQQKETAAHAAISDSTEFKRMMGFEQDASLKDVQDEFERQVKDVPAENHSYRAALTWMDNLLRAKITAENEYEEKMEGLRTRLAQAEAAKKAQNDTYLAAQKAAEADLASQTQKFNADRTQLETDKTQLSDQLATMRKTVDDELARAESIKKDAQDQVTELDNLNKSLNDKFTAFTSETFEVAAGEVYRVNQLHGVVWINLGSDDALRRQVTFSVYTSDPNDVARRKSKAKIEVTRILGPHLAEARILEDTYSDPITPGDLINTPLWSPGEKQHFALAGFMDIDGDSTDDRQLIRDIIALNGGVIDAELNDKGDIEGKITINTNYIVVGTQKEGALPGLSELQADARKLGVKIITVDKFLDLAGWKDKTRVLRFGQGQSAGFSGNAPETSEFKFRSPPKRDLPDLKYAEPKARK